MASYLVNRSLFTFIKMKTFIEVGSSTLTNYFILKIFGYATYTHVNNSKLEKKVHKCIIFNDQYRIKDYRLQYIEPGSHKLIASRDITFDEKVIIYSRKELVLMSKDHGVRCMPQKPDQHDTLYYFQKIFCYLIY